MGRTPVEWAAIGASRTDAVMGTCTSWTQLQSHEDALQQSGDSCVQVEMFVLSVAATSGSCTACIVMAGASWQAAAIVAPDDEAGSGAVVTVTVACPNCIVIAATATPDPLRTRLMHNRARRRMRRADMARNFTANQPVLGSSFVNGHVSIFAAELPRTRSGQAKCDASRVTFGFWNDGFARIDQKWVVATGVHP